jgi:hypothetical protein
MQSYKTHPFYTHQPFFKEILKNTTGNILECGCGEGSTLMIKEAIHGSDRKLVSLESNKEWLNKYMHLEDANHTLYHVDTANDDTDETGALWVKFIETNHLRDFEVVFIDSSPWLSRKHILEHFKDKAKIIIIHDFDYFPIHNIIGRVMNSETRDGKQMIMCDLTGVVNNYKLFYPPYEYFTCQTGPPTLICSNILPDNEFYNLIDIVDTNSKSYY